MPFGLMRTGASLLSGPFVWIAGAAVVALVITGLSMVRSSGYAAAETRNLRAVAQAERAAGEKLAADLGWLQHRQGRARDTETELRREVDLWRERAREQEQAMLAQLEKEGRLRVIHEPTAENCRIWQAICPLQGSE